MSVDASLRYEDIVIGAVYEFTRVVSEDDGRTFVALTDDVNTAGGTMAHGMHTASLFSTLIDMYCPAGKNLHMSQTLQFRKGVFFGDRLTVRATVISKSDSIHLLTLKTEVLRGQDVVVSGEAKVKML